MEKGKDIQKELKLSLLKRLTGRQDPQLKRIVSSVLIGILFFLFVFFAGFFLNKALIPRNVNVVFNPFIRDGYIPIDITNGHKNLNDIKLKIRTCYMDNFKTLNAPDLIPNQKDTLKFRDEDTFLALNNLYDNPDFKCDKNNISTTAQCWIKTYIVNGKLYAPPQECKEYRCGNCNYTILIKAKHFDKEINGSFPPIDVLKYNLYVSPFKEIKGFEKINKTFFSLVGISVYTSKELCVLNAGINCERLPDKIPSTKNFTMEISPANKSLGNLTLKLNYKS